MTSRRQTQAVVGLAAPEAGILLMYRVESVPEVQFPLVNKFYKACRYSGKAVHGDSVFALKGAQGLAAAVRLEPKSDGWYCLRSMCVAPELRGQGLGSQLLHGLQDFLQQHPCYCYPFDHLQSFYQPVGFRLQDPHTAPAEMQAAFHRYRAQGRKIILMVRPLAQ